MKTFFRSEHKLADSPRRKTYQPMSPSGSNSLLGSQVHPFTTVTGFNGEFNCKYHASFFYTSYYERISVRQGFICHLFVLLFFYLQIMKIIGLL